MCVSPERRPETQGGPVRRGLSRPGASILPGSRNALAAAGLLLLLFVALCLGGMARADPAAELTAMVERAQELLDDESTTTEALEAVRSQLASKRDAAVAAQQESAPEVTELEARIASLGPPPAEGATEPPEIAQLREQLTAQLTEAQAPARVIGEVVSQANTVIAQIDQMVRARFSAELVARAPSPLLPSTWIVVGNELDDRVGKLDDRLRAQLSQPEVMAQMARRLPVHLGIAMIGFLLAVVVRRRIGDWIDRRLARGVSARLSAWIIALRNLNRLLLPAAGAALIIAALDPAGLMGGELQRSLVRLPAPVILLILASWLATSLFSPGAAEHREVPLENLEAKEATVLTLTGGVVLASALVLRDLFTAWDLSTTTQAFLAFIVIIPIGAAVLWRMSRLLDLMALRLPGGAPPAPPSPLSPEEGESNLLPRLLRLGARLLRLIAGAMPVLGALGFIPAAAFLGVGALSTLALVGLGLVVFLLLSTTATAVFAPASGPGSAGGALNGGLIPVFIGLVVVLACLPLLALIWGARPSDIRDVWSLLRNGVMLGGVHVSLNVALVFLSVFGLLLGATRLLQGVLRSTVLPRTRLDSGARDAVLAGVSYVGYALAVIAGISAAGVNLSSLAIVAGALSVGIGFGLQTIVSNFVSGIILLVERPIKQGDWIEVGGQAGYVRGIRVRSTEIETFDRASLIVPNSDLIAGVVLNRTHMGLSGRLVVPVSVAYDSDPREVERLLLEIADGHPLILETPPPTVLFMGLGSDQLDFELRCRLRDVNFSLSVRSDLNFTIVERFRAAGLDMPIPARSRAALIVAEQTVHHDTPPGAGPAATPAPVRTAPDDDGA